MAMNVERRSPAGALSRRLSVQVAARASSTTHHQAETPKRYRSVSATQAPTLPPRLRISPTATLCDQPGSARLKVPRTSDRYRAAATRTNSRDSRSSAATLLGRGAWFRFKWCRTTPTAPSVDGQYGFVQEDRAGAHVDVASRLEVLHHPADHLARSADHFCNVLLREFPGDHLLAVHGLGHLQQQVRHPAVHIHEGEAADLLVGLAQALDQPAHDGHGHLEVLGQTALEVALGELEQLAGLERGYARRAGMVVDQAHLAEELVRAQYGEDDLAALVVADHHLEAARDHHVEGLGHVARGDDGGAAREALAADRTGQQGQLILGEHREQRHVA